MNIVNRVTLRHMRLNKKRTAITVIGVIISVAMVTGVLTLGISFLDTMKRDITIGEGGWHAQFYAVNSAQLSAIEKDENTKSALVSKDIGYAELPHVENRNKPYLFVKEYNQDGFSKSPLTLTEGRMPKRAGEILLAEDLNGKDGMNYHIGDVLELSLGKRYSDTNQMDLDQTWNIMWDENGRAEERFIPEKTVRYTVTGFMESAEEMSWSPGYTSIAFLDESNLAEDEKVNVSIIFKEVTNQAVKDITVLGDELGIEKYGFHSKLLSLDGVMENDALRSTLYTLTAIVMIIIIVGSVSLIYNAFAISVSERARNLGMLSSIGATSRQKRNSVFFEGAVIGLISIPLGILGGVVGIGITFACINSMMKDVLNLSVDFQVILNISVVAGAILISALTIFISAYIPAVRASHVSPIEAIRQSQDVRLTQRTVKTAKLTRKIFGMEGDIALKNLKRNRRRYQATVFSLVVSMVLFLTVSYFGEGLRQSLAMTQSGYDYDVMVLFSNNDEVRSKDADAADVLQINGITRAADYISFYSESAAETKKPSVIVYAADDAYLKKYAKEIGADFNQLTDRKHPAAIAIEPLTYQDQQNGRYVKENVLPIKQGEPWQLNYTVYNEVSQTSELKPLAEVSVNYFTDEIPFGVASKVANNQGILVISRAVLEELHEQDPAVQKNMPLQRELYVNTTDPLGFQKEVESLENNDLYVYNLQEMKQKENQMLLLMAVFVYGFIILITAIGAANIFNTISTSIALRKREFAMLKSVGMTPAAFRRMIRYESAFYGLKAILYGIPISLLVMIVLYKTYVKNFDFGFHIPWACVACAAVAVVLIVGLAMSYSSRKLKNESIIDGLKAENI